MLALNQEFSAPSLPQFVSLSVLQELDELREVASIYHCEQRNVLLLVLLPSLLPPARHLKQHIVPEALDFHCFNTMSFFRRGLSEAFRLKAEQTSVVNSPLPFDSDQTQLQFVQTGASECVVWVYSDMLVLCWRSTAKELYWRFW